MAIKIDGKLSTAAADGILADASEIQVSDGVMLDQKIAELEDSIEVGGGGSSGDGLTEEQVREIVTEETSDLQPLTEIDASVDEETFTLTLLLKDKNGEELSSKTVTLPSKNGQPDLSEYVKNTDYANGITGGVVKISSDTLGLKIDDLGFLSLAFANNTDIEYRHSRALSSASVDEIVKVGITANNKTLTEEEQATARGWIGAVGKKDKAMAGKLGLVSASDIFCFQVNTSGNPMARILPLETYKTTTTAAFMSKGTLENIKNTYVKEGITTNTETWTDEEKASACETIGALPLSGGQMTGEIKLGQGDNKGINLGAQGVINSGTNTVLGFIYSRFCIGSYRIPTVIRTSEEKLRVQLGISGSGNENFEYLATEKYVDALIAELRGEGVASPAMMFYHFCNGYIEDLKQAAVVGFFSYKSTAFEDVAEFISHLTSFAVFSPQVRMIIDDETYENTNYMITKIIKNEEDEYLVYITYDNNSVLVNFGLPEFTNGCGIIDVSQI